MFESAGRRSFLRTVGCGVTAATAGCLARVGPRRRVRIPTLLSGDRVVRRTGVPRAWAEHVRTVETARRKLGELTGALDGIAGLRVARSGVQYGGRDGLRLGVELDGPPADVGLPDEIEGVPLRLESAPERGLSACYNDDAYDPVPGGVVFQPTPDGGFGTACCRVLDDGDDRLLTAAHLWRSCDGRIDVDSPAYQSGRYVGRVDRYDTAMDAALVEPDGDIGVDDAIKLEGPTRKPVRGVVSDWGLAVLVTGDERVHNVGSASGHTTGVVTAKNVEDGWNRCVNFGGRGVEAEYHNVVGDSGGPTFYTHDGDAYLVNLQQMWVDRTGEDCNSHVASDRARGTAAARVRKRFGVHFAE